MSSEKRSAQDTLPTAATRSGATRHVPTRGKRALPVTDQAPRKRGRQEELEQAKREVDGWDMRSYCHIFKL
jgi:hypothetical protein